VNNILISRRPLAVAASAIALAGFVAVPVVASTAAGASTSSPAHLVRVGRAPRLPAHTRRLGFVRTSRVISGSVALKPRNPKALEAAALAVSNPKSSRYRQYIPKGAFAKYYGPTAATLSGVKTALSASHLTVTGVSSNGLLVHYKGTVGAAESAFHTRVANVRLARTGQVGMATTSAISLPSTIASQVVNVTGLNTLGRAASSSLEHATHPAAVSPVTHAIPHYSVGPNACSAATSIASDFGGLTDDQIANAYGLDNLYKAGDDGAGQHIALVEFEPFDSADLAKFDKCYYKSNAAAMASQVTVKNIDGGPGTGAGSGEAILDVEDLQGLAPGADIDVYQAPNAGATGTDLYNQIVTDDTDQVVSSSWGFCEADAQSFDPGGVALENEIFEQAALQGQSVFSAAGDSGADDCAYNDPGPSTPSLSVDDPSSQPFVTAVGGTTITAAKNSPTEQVWNDGSVGGAGGGGVSSVWQAPSWQQPFLDKAAAADAVSDSDLSPCPGSATAALCRELPDVSAQADEYTGAITVYTDTYGGWTTFGGTSSAAPIWAAILTDIDASAGCSSGPVGFVSPSLYAVASVHAEDIASFNDITAGNNDMYDNSDNTLFAAHSGYDMATGLGTPKVTGATGQAGLAAYLCALSGSSTPATISSVSPATVSPDTTGSLTLSGSHFTDATAVSISGYAVPTADWQVVDDSTITIDPIPTAAQVATGGLGPLDGTGPALISVTSSTGSGQVSSPITPLATVVYLAGTTASPVPAVDAVSDPGGVQAGGNTVTIYGSGFTQAGGVTAVTFGGVPATSWTLDSDSMLTATVPAYDSGTTACETATDPTTDVCQSQVIVSNANGPSATDPILEPSYGAPYPLVSAGEPAPTCVTDSTCEILPAPTEYDYLATPTITSVVTTSASDPTAWASEQGTTIATITGTGFDPLGYYYTNVGDPTHNASQDTNTVSITPTKVQVIINGRGSTTEPKVAALSVQTEAGLTAQGPSISYAGTPQVTSVSPFLGPDTGGTQFTLQGKGFQGIDAKDGGMLAYEYVEFGVSGTQLAGYHATSDTAVTANTPASNPGAFIVTACTLTGCSQPSAKTVVDDLFDFYQPGDPVVTSLSVAKGPASGGTRLLIQGRNLSDAISVEFGHQVTEAVNAPEILTNGSSTEVEATTPPGTAGKTVHVRVMTVESYATGTGFSPSSSGSAFTYRSSVPSAPRSVTGKVHGTTIRASWKTPLSDGGHPIKRYVVSAVAYPNSTAKGAKKPPTVSVETTNPRVHSATLTALRRGWVYRLQVRAVNSVGRGLAGGRHAYFVHDPA